MVAFLEVASQHEGGEDLLLEYLDDFEFSTSLDLESLEFSDGPILVVDDVPLLELFVLLPRCWDHHALVGTINFKEDGHLSNYVI